MNSKTSISLSYVFLILPVISYFLISEFDLGGAFTFFLVLICLFGPFFSLFFGFKSKQKGPIKWIAIILNLVVLSTVTLMAFVGAFLI